MQKIYKTTNGLILEVSPYSKQEYLNSSAYKEGQSWENYLSQNGYTDPDKIKPQDVEKVLFKGNHSTEDLMIFLEHELCLLLAKNAIAKERASEVEEPKYNFRVEKYNNMLLLLEKMKLNQKAIDTHAIFGGED